LTVAPSALLAGRVRSGPILIGYDGSRAAEQAIREAAALVKPQPALVVVVWKAGLAFELIEPPTSAVGLPPAPLDVRSALETERSIYERAQEGAQRAAGLARALGLHAEALVVAEDPDVPVAETLLALAHERDAAALVTGAHRRGSGVGSTSRHVLRDAECPVLVAREPAST
jgi:nucleotide-binding universal stress UspA family protein